MDENSDDNNPSILSSKKGPTCHIRSCCRSRRDSGPDSWRDVERLRATLEVERSRNQQAHRRFSLELRRQREEAREERERALRELTYRHEQQKTLELIRQREALGRERAAEVRRLLRWREGKLAESSTLRQTREVKRQLADEIAGISRTGVQGLKPGCKGNGAAYRKLEELLKTLLAQADGQQVALLQRLQQEVALEKSYFLCHLLEAHGRPSLEVDQKGNVAKPSRTRSKSCVHLLSGVKDGNLALFRSRSLSRSESPQPMKKKKKQDSETPPLSSSPTEEEASKGDLPEPCSPDERSEKGSTSRCSEDNMDDLKRPVSFYMLSLLLESLHHSPTPV